MQARLPALPQLPKDQHYQQQIPPQHSPTTSVAYHVTTMSQETPLLPTKQTEENIKIILPNICNHVICENTRKIHSYRSVLKTENKEKWTTLFTNEMGRLLDGVGKRLQKGTNTLFPIKQYNIPKE